MEQKPSTEPRAAAHELAALALGLEAHLRRRRAWGLRRVAQGPPHGPQQDAAPVGPPPSTLADRGPASREWIQPQPPPERAKTAAPTRAESFPRSAARLAAEAEARSVRERALQSSSLIELQSAVAGCTACGLCSTRTQTVFADGDGSSGVMFVGEAPGADEDARGVPFVGRAGALLTDIITKGMGLRREQVYIANVLKCRPPANRDPSDTEKLTCTPWLDRQVELVAPRVIIPLGRHAANHVLGTELPMGRLRGQVFASNGRHVVPTFHPAYLLRSPGMKKECWKDIQLAMGLLGLTPPGGGR